MFGCLAHGTGNVFVRFRSRCRAPARDREQKRPFLFPARDSRFPLGTFSRDFVPGERLAKRDGECVTLYALSAVLEMWRNVSILRLSIIILDFGYANDLCGIDKPIP